jgi:hypothetical protein
LLNTRTNLWKQSKRFKRESSFLTERGMCWQRPSGMPNTQDEHEDWDLIIHGASGLPRT